MNDIKSQNKQSMTDREIQAEKKRKELAIKKARQALNNASEEEKQEIFKKVHINRTVEQPKTAKGKIENFWYHYKVITIVVVLLIGIASYMIYDIVTKIRYDLTITIVTTQDNVTPTDRLSEFESEIKKYADDYNKSNKIDIMISDLRIGEKTDPLILQAGVTKYTVSLGNSDDFIYIYDEDTYNRSIEQGAIYVDLSNKFNNENINQDKYYLKNDDRFSKLIGYENLVLVVKDIENMPKQDNDKKQNYNNAMDFVTKLINDR